MVDLMKAGLVARFRVSGLCSDHRNSFPDPTRLAQSLENLENLALADAYFGRGRDILEERRRIERLTLEHWRLLHHKIAA